VARENQRQERHFFAILSATSQCVVQLSQENSNCAKQALAQSPDCASIGSVQDDFCTPTFLNFDLDIFAAKPEGFGDF